MVGKRAGSTGILYPCSEGNSLKREKITLQVRPRRGEICGIGREPRLKSAEGRLKRCLNDVRTQPFQIIAADHTGITVTDLERSLAFWRDVLGFQLSHRPHQSGKLASEITGVPGAEISIAVLKGYGHKIELLEYLAPSDRTRSALRPCDVGSVHVAFTVDDLDALLERIAASGWHAAGSPQTLQSGPNAGKRVVYVRDPDGTTIEFMEPPPDKS